MQQAAHIEAEVKRIASVLGAPSQLLPAVGHLNGGEGAHIEVDSYGYHYVVMERGVELDRHFTIDLDDLLFYTFDNVASELANQVLHSSSVGADDRSADIHHLTKLQMLGWLSSAWRERARRRW